MTIRFKSYYIHWNAIIWYAITLVLTIYSSSNYAHSITSPSMYVSNNIHVYNRCSALYHYIDDYHAHFDPITNIYPAPEFILKLNIPTSCSVNSHASYLRNIIIPQLLFQFTYESWRVFDLSTDPTFSPQSNNKFRQCR